MRNPLMKIGTEEFWGRDVLSKYENGVRWTVVKFDTDSEGFWLAQWRNDSGEVLSQNLLTKDYHTAKLQIVQQIHGSSKIFSV